MKRENPVPLINEQSFVFQFLPGETISEKEEQRDFLFLVIEDIVSLVYTVVYNNCIVIISGQIAQQFYKRNEEFG